MQPISPAIDAERLQRFNLQMLAQALDLVAAHETPGSTAYGGVVGAHLRHVIEHFDALLFPARAGEVDYDGRARDRELERQPQRARQRLLALQRRLGEGAVGPLDTPLRVRGLGGAAGDFAFDVASSLGRELVFVASHAVHHFALLRAHCEQHGIAIDADFGTAPATIAHQRQLAKEAPCHTLSPTA